MSEEPVLVLISSDPRDSGRAFEAMRIGVGVVAFAGPFDFDHLRAEIGKHARTVRAGEHAGEIEDGEARQRKVMG